MNNAIVIGSGQLAFNCALMLYDKGYKVQVYEYNAYDMSLLGKKCKKREIEYLAVKKEELTTILKNVSEITLVVSANNTYIFPREVLDNSCINAINFHPALLPLYPGRNAECWAIYNMDECTGVTWHFINNNIDQGRIIKQKKIEIANNDTSLTVMMKQFKVATEVFGEILEEISLDGIDALSTVENKTQKSDIHYSYEAPNDGKMELTWSIDKMYAFCRAMDYGALKVLGEPCCLIENITYTWDSYSFEENKEGETTVERDGIFADGTHVLKLGGVESQIRPMTQSDISDCVELFLNSSLNEIYHRSKIVIRRDLENAITKERCMVVDNNGAIAYIRYSYEGMFGHMPFLDTILVDESIKKQGVGSALEDYMCKDLKKKLKTRLFLNVADCNVQASMFYQKNGYEQVGRVPDMYKKGIDEILMMNRIG